MSESAGDNSNKALQWRVLRNGKTFLTILETQVQDSPKEESKGELSVFLLGCSLFLMIIITLIIITSYGPYQLIVFVIRVNNFIILCVCAHTHVKYKIKYKIMIS